MRGLVQMCPVMAMTSLSPGLILILGAAGVPFLRGLFRQVYLVALPLLSLLLTALFLEEGVFGRFVFLGIELELVRVDRLSTIFGIIFSIAAALGVLYSLHDRDPVQQVAGIDLCWSGDLCRLCW